MRFAFTKLVVTSVAAMMMFISSSAEAADCPITPNAAGQVYIARSGDYNADTIPDIFLEPASFTQIVPIPYDIQVDLDRVSESPPLVLISSGTGLFGLIPNPPAANLASVVWGPARHTVRAGDFNGDGNQDIILQAKIQGEGSAVLLGIDPGAFVSLIQSIVPLSLGGPISEAAGKSLCAQDLNQDGRDDLLVETTGVADQVSYADETGVLGPLVPHPGCTVGSEPDTDCDGVIDRYDAFAFDPGESVDTDLDGMGNNADLDDDGDGIADGPDAFDLDPLNGQPVGATDGQFAVTNTGKASYRIPINMVPSVAGVLEPLALAYDGQLGNDLIGMGWSIEGLSQITRCPTTLVQDGHINAVNFNSSDKICLDGQRLQAISGAYGFDGTIYRFEIDNYTRVESRGSAASGTRWFEVRTKDGRIRQYGRVANTRRATQGRNAALTWAIERVEDREGNFAAFIYQNNSATGEFYITRINYTGNAAAGLAATNSIRFSYQARVDVSPSHANSTLTDIRTRLTRISSYLGTAEVRSYQLAYSGPGQPDYDGVGGRSRLKSVTQCTPDTGCLAPTTFNWDTHAATPTFSDVVDESDALSFPAGQNYRNLQYFIGDVNGDGKSDIVWTYRNVNQLGRVVYLSTGSGFIRQAPQIESGFAANIVPEADQSTLSGDVNGDGKMDLVWVARHQSTIYRSIFLANSAGTGFTFQGYEQDTEADYVLTSDGRYEMADVNGDGRTDLVWTFVAQNRLGASVYLATTGTGGQVALAKSSRLTDADLSPDFYENQEFRTGDVNGDGRADLVWTFTNQNKLSRVLYLSTPNGGGFAKISVGNDSNIFPTGNLYMNQQIQLADVNGDRKSDLIWTYTYNNQLGRILYLSSQLGTSFERVFSALDNGPLQPNTHSIVDSRLADLNGDGKTDLIYNYTDSANSRFGYICFLANGDGRGWTESGADARVTDPTYQNLQYRYGDVTGDGVFDLVWLYNTSGNVLRRRALAQPTAYPDHIQSITDGLGKQTLVQYDYMANPAVYQPGTGTVYPSRDDSGAGYVVKRIDVSNGLGNSLSRVDYAYSGARTGLRGRGFLGFEERRVTDVLTGFVTTERFRQDFPYIGRIESSVIAQSGGAPLEKVYHHWRNAALIHPGTNTVFAFIKDSAFVKYELDGVEITSKVTFNVYDNAYGNLIGTGETVGLGFTGAIGANFDRNGSFVLVQIASRLYTVFNNLVYLDDGTANWRIGFLSRETSTNIVTDTSQPNKVVINSYVPYSPTSQLLLSQTSFEGSGIESTRTFTRDGFGNATMVVTTADDIDGGQIAPQNSSTGPFLNGLYPLTRTNDRGHVTTLTYDQRIGEVTKSVDPNGLVTDSIYDGFGRLVEQRSPEGALTQFAYQPCTLSLCTANSVYQVARTVTHPRRRGVRGEPTVVRFYDRLNREVRTVTASFTGGSIVVDTIFDGRGRRVALSEPFYDGDTALYTVWIYDDLDRVTWEGAPDGGRVAFTYASDSVFASRLTSVETIVTPFSGTRLVPTTRQYNALGQLVVTTDAYSTTTAMNYDAQGNLAWARIGGDLSTQVTVTTDVAGNQTMISDPDAGVITTEYDGLFRTRRKIHGSGIDQSVDTIVYDGLNRLLARWTTVNGVTDVASFAYDTSANGIGLPFYEFVSNQHLKVYQYDSLSRPNALDISFASASTRTVSFTYDEFGSRKTTRYPSGFEVAVKYNTNGYRSEIRDVETGHRYWKAIVRDARGNYTHVRFGNGLDTVRVIRPDNGLVQSIHTGPTTDPDAIQALAYNFDTSANLYSRLSQRLNTENITEVFGYDLLNRLTSSTTNGLPGASRQLTYQYNIFGNIRTKSDVSDALGYHYGAVGSGAGTHAVSAIDFQGTTTSYTYDGRGNMTTAGNRTIEYSAFNKPKRITEPGTELLFSYDATRTRSRQQATVDGVLTDTHYYAFDGGRFEVVEENGQIREKSYFEDYVVHSSLRSTDGAGIGNDISYLHRDHLGSTEAVTDAQGQLEARMVFAPYGSRRADDWSDPSPAFTSALASRTFQTTTEGFGAHEHLDAVGLIHMGGRVYDPRIGRFLSPDAFVEFPELGQNYNRYSYALNNPLSISDPTGNLPIIPIIIIAYKIYDTYDTVTSGVEDLNTTLDSSRTTSERVTAGASLFFNAVGVPKPIRKIAGKTVDVVADRTPKVITDGIARQADRVSSAVDRATSRLDSLGVGDARARSRTGRDAQQGFQSDSGDDFRFRGDSRSSDEIFEDGFTARGDSTDLFAHAENNTRPPSAFVSTSKSFEVAEGFDPNSVFVVRARDGIDVNRTLGNRSPFPEELEVAVPFGIDARDVRAVTLPREGISILNPNFEP